MNESILIVDDEKEIADLIEVWMLWNVLKRKKWIWQF